jgi:signal transduction histidine kinase
MAEKRSIWPIPTDVFEDKVLKVTLLAVIFIAGFFLITDAIANDFTSVAIESAAIVFTFIILQSYKSGVQRELVALYAAIIMLVTINLSWYFTGSFGMTNTALYLLVVQVLIIILPRRLLLPMLIIIFATLTAYFLIELNTKMDFGRKISITPSMLVTMYINSLIIFAAGVYLMHLLIRGFEQERTTREAALGDLYDSNQAIMAQNEELLQQKEEITTQREYIEQKNKELEKKSDALELANWQIREINSNLEEKVEARTRALQLLNKELDQLFYRSSHDFRRPITSLTGLVTIANMTLTDSAALELFNKVSDTAGSMYRLIEKMQMLYEISLFDPELSPRHDWKSMQKNLLNKFLEGQPSNGLSINFNVQLQKYAGDDPRNLLIELILVNLIENALAYNIKNTKEVLISVSEQHNELLLIVKDNGQGIPEQFLERVYEMYFRGNLASSGNGLGLYVVRKAVNKMQGSIRIQSKANEFTELSIKMPMYL